MTSADTPQPRYVQLTFPCGLTSIITHGVGPEIDGRVLYSFTRLYGVEKGPSKFQVPTQAPALFLFEGNFSWHTRFFTIWGVKAEENDRIERFRKVGVSGLVDLGMALIPQLPPYDIFASRQLQDKFESTLAPLDPSAEIPTALQFDKLSRYHLKEVAIALNM